MNKRIKQMREEYYSIPIPNELDDIVNKALQVKPKKKNINKTSLRVFLPAAAIVLLTISVNMSPALASTLSEIPVLGKFIKIITFNEIKDSKNNSEIIIKTPAIQGLENKGLEDNLNTKYIEESKELYKEF